MGLKTLCSNGCTLRVTVNSKETNFDSFSILGNVRVTLVDSDGDDCVSIRGMLKRFDNSGNVQLDMANTKDRRYPNTTMNGAEEIINGGVMYHITNALRKKNVKTKTFAVAYDEHEQKWVKVDTRQVEMEELVEDAKALIDAIDEETTARPAKEEKKDAVGDSAATAKEALGQ